MQGTTNCSVAALPTDMQTLYQKGTWLSEDVKKSNRSNAATYDARCLQSAARNCQSFLSFKKARMIGRI
jgi:hypothetical protein